MLFILCLLLLSLAVRIFVRSLFYGEVLGVLSCLAIILLRKRGLIALLYVVAVSVLCHFLTVLSPRVGLKSGISLSYSLTFQRYLQT